VNGSGSGFGSGSFHHQEKQVGKSLISTLWWDPDLYQNITDPEHCSLSHKTSHLRLIKTNKKITVKLQLVWKYWTGLYRVYYDKKVLSLE
jgi:hypothetical protein